RDEHHHLDAVVLETDPVGQGAEEMAEVEWTGWPVAGQNTELLGVAFCGAFELPAARRGGKLRRCDTAGRHGRASWKLSPRTVRHPKTRNGPPEGGPLHS